MLLGALSDFDLVRKTNEGSVEAFTVIVERYQKPLTQFSMRYVGDLASAEDIVQESFLKAFEKLSTFQFRSAFKSWLYRIVINTAKNYLRNQKSVVDIDAVQIVEESECEQNLMDRQLIEKASDLIKDLPTKQREALQLRVFEDKSFAEVAEKMECPYDTAKANYRHGLIKLQESLVLTW